jgi:hypothetical protein
MPEEHAYVPAVTSDATLYARIRPATLALIRAAAQADNRSVTSWVERHFTDYFETLDAQCSSPPLSSSDRSSSRLLLYSDLQRPALPTLIDPFGIRPATETSSQTSELE